MLLHCDFHFSKVFFENTVQEFKGIDFTHAGSRFTCASDWYTKYSKLMLNGSHVVWVWSFVAFRWVWFSYVQTIDHLVWTSKNQTTSHLYSRVVYPFYNLTISTLFSKPWGCGDVHAAKDLNTSGMQLSVTVKLLHFLCASRIKHFTVMRSVYCYEGIPIMICIIQTVILFL